jgi:molybdopterin-guanine dinucleotide biosynthesis protein A
LASLPVEPDRHPNIGPIGGLESLLLARPGCACILLACDMPNLNAELLTRLMEPASDADAIVCTTTSEPPWHPCCALYRPACLPIVQAAIAARRYGMIDLLGRLRVHPVALTGDEARWVANWNEPNDVPVEAHRPRPQC